MSPWMTLRVMGMFRRLVGRVPAAHLWYLLRRMRNEKPHVFAGQVRINSFFPPYPSPAFDRFCEAICERRRVPFSTYLAATSACPFSCQHCSYAGRPAEQMSTAQMLDVITQVKALGTCTLGLTGGEPLLRDDLEMLIRAAGPEMATIVFTSGHGLDGARASRLAEAGVSCVTIGIEHSDPAEHDRIRGRAGSFEQVREAAGRCRTAGVYMAISTIGTREKIASGELERMYELGRQWGAAEFRILAPVATGGLSGSPKEMLTTDERRALFDFHVNHNRRRGGPAIASFAYLESDEVFGCGAGYHHLYIDAAGNVCPCDLTPLSFGKVTTEPLAAIWERMAAFFARPRRGCLMSRLAHHVATGSELPLPPETSTALCAACAAASDKDLPEGYRRLLG